MVCGRCNAENSDDGRYCRSCGASLGTACTQCGVPCAPDDRYCGSCGAALPLALADEPPALASDVPTSGPAAVRQFTPQEIEFLLRLRRSIKKEETTIKTLRQDDVDKLFG